jgi:hypothetical protein
LSLPRWHESSTTVEFKSALITPLHLSFPRKRESSAVLESSPGSCYFSLVIPTQAGIQ